MLVLPISDQLHLIEAMWIIHINRMWTEAVHATYRPLRKIIFHIFSLFSFLPEMVGSVCNMLSIRHW